MNPEIEKEAIEFAKRCDPLNENIPMQAHLAMGYRRGAEEWSYNPSGQRSKLSLLINFVNQEMGNTVEWTGDHWQWKK